MIRIKRRISKVGSGAGVYFSKEELKVLNANIGDYLVLELFKFNESLFLSLTDMKSKNIPLRILLRTIESPIREGKIIDLNDGELILFDEKTEQSHAIPLELISYIDYLVKEESLP